MGASRAAVCLLALLPAALAAVSLQPEEQPQQSFPFSLPPGQNATNDLSLDEPPLVSRLSVPDARDCAWASRALHIDK